MHVLFIGIWMTVSDYNTNPTVIILASWDLNLNEMHVLFIQTHSNYTSWDWNLNEMHVLFIDHICMTVSDNNTNPTVIILVGIGILTKCMFYSLISV